MNDYKAATTKSLVLRVLKRRTRSFTTTATMRKILRVRHGRDVPEGSMSSLLYKLYSDGIVVRAPTGPCGGWGFRMWHSRPTNEKLGEFIVDFLYFKSPEEVWFSELCECAAKHYFPEEADKFGNMFKIDIRTGLSAAVAAGRVMLITNKGYVLSSVEWMLRAGAEDGE